MWQNSTTPNVSICKKKLKCETTHHSKFDKTQNATKLKYSKSKTLTKLKNLNVTKLKLKIWKKLKTENVTKLKHAKCEITQKLKMWQISKTQNVTKLKMWRINSKILVYMLCTAVKPDDHRRAVWVVGSSVPMMSHTAFPRLVDNVTHSFSQT